MCVMYCRAAKLGEPTPKGSNGAQVLETVVVGAFTGLPAQTICPAPFVVEFSALVMVEDDEMRKMLMVSC